MALLSNPRAITRPLQLINRVLQWSSVVIVLGITSFFIHRGPKGQHIIYQEVIAAISVVFFLPAFLSPFLQTALGGVVLAIDIVFTYLWLTAFIFASQDYSQHNCRLNSPPGLSCSKKHANQSFIFLAFIFTFFGMFLEVAGLWAAKKSTTATNGREKNGGTAGAATQEHPAEGAATATA